VSRSRGSQGRTRVKGQWLGMRRTKVANWAVSCRSGISVQCLLRALCCLSKSREDAFFIVMCCRRLPHKCPQKNKKALRFRTRLCFNWWALKDLNLGPRDYESPATLFGSRVVSD